MDAQWNPVVVGLDATPGAAAAARVAWDIARIAETTCYPVHAIRDQAAEVAPYQLPMDVAPMNRVLAELAQGELKRAFGEEVPPRLLERLEIRPGRPAVVLAAVAAASDAELIVLGGKHRGTLGRWLAGSTAHDLLRLGGHPVLVTGPGARLPRRVLAAVDLSEAATATLTVAQRFAALFRAELLVLHVVEVAALVPGAVVLPEAILDDELLLKRTEQWFDTAVWPLVHYAKVDRRIVRGQVTPTVRAQAAKWGADVVALGSHGKNWVDRLLLGSTTERLIADLPTSLLVVPAARAAREGPRAPGGAHQRVSWTTNP
ncbi:MAG: universal stress protein [Gemmatimonadetes bacterium]|nr:universal stress protein [Gemmatimonadota bacterium]